MNNTALGESKDHIPLLFRRTHYDRTRPRNLDAAIWMHIEQTASVIWPCTDMQLPSESERFNSDWAVGSIASSIRVVFLVKSRIADLGPIDEQGSWQLLPQEEMKCFSQQPGDLGLDRAYQWGEGLSEVNNA